MAGSSEIQSHHCCIGRLNIFSQAITIGLDRGDPKHTVKSGLRNHINLSIESKTQSEVLANYSSKLDAMIVQLADSGILKKKCLLNP